MNLLPNQPELFMNNLVYLQPQLLAQKYRNSPMTKKDHYNPKRIQPPPNFPSHHLIFSQLSNVKTQKKKDSNPSSISLFSLPHIQFQVFNPIDAAAQPSLLTKQSIAPLTIRQFSLSFPFTNFSLCKYSNLSEMAYFLFLLFLFCKTLDFWSSTLYSFRNIPGSFKTFPNK